jgi:hypothetical protein
MLPGLSSKYAPKMLSSAELADVSRPEVASEIVREFQAHLAAPRPEVRAEAWTILAQNSFQLGFLLPASWIAQAPMVLTMSWTPMPELIRRTPAVAASMMGANVGFALATMRNFNNAVRQ